MGYTKAQREAKKATASRVQQDTIETPKEPKSIPTSPQKKGLDPFTKSFVDLAATQAKQAIDLRFDNPDKSIASQEASSVAQASARLLIRHYGKTVKKFLPKGAQSEDANDFKEIGIALLMWGMRWFKITIEESAQKKKLGMAKREQQIAKLKSQTAMYGATRTAETPRAEQPTRQPDGPRGMDIFGTTGPYPGGVTTVNSAQMRNDTRLMSELDQIMQQNGGTLGVAE